MKWSWRKKEISLDTLLQRLESVHATVSRENVTPENCMRSPTVHAIVTSISRRIAASPIHVFQKTTDKGKSTKKKLPSHPVQRLLINPNSWQNGSDFWLDAASSLVRWGRFFAFKARGKTGPIRRLIPLQSGRVSVKQDENFGLVFLGPDGRYYEHDEMLYARSAARDYYTGDSPVTDVRESIALEIAAEKFGATFFGNGAVPLLVFQLMQGFQDFKSPEERDSFLSGVRQSLSGNRRHRAFLLPKGMQLSEPVKIDNDKAQFLETRKYQRTVIAGAFGVPPHLVGDLERATFNNVEQQDKDFVINVVLPVARCFESAMERDLLTPADRAAGIIIRFNLDAVQRADFKSRQEGLRIQRDSGVINANEWREIERMNPISGDDGGDDYIRPLNFAKPGEDRNE